MRWMDWSVMIENQSSQSLSLRFMFKVVIVENRFLLTKFLTSKVAHAEQREGESDERFTEHK